MARALTVPARRLHAQRIARPTARTPAEVVAWLGAVQAQDYLQSRWALGVRMAPATAAPEPPYDRAAGATSVVRAAATAADVDAALADGSIIRTHVFRGTWQYVARADARWLVELVAARVIARSASRYRELGLDARTLARACDALARATEGGAELTRAEVNAVLARAKIAPDGQRAPHILGHAEYQRVICSGARRGKQTTFAAFDARVPPAAPRPRDEAIAELAVRYVRSRGPASVQDFAWWAGLTLTEARAGFTAVAAAPGAIVDGETAWFAAPDDVPVAAAHLLPVFDEYLVAYADRADVLAPAHARRVNAGGGLLHPAVVAGGMVVGTWRRTFERGTGVPRSNPSFGGSGFAVAGEHGRLAVELEPFRRWTRAEQAAIVVAAERYAAFEGAALEVRNVARIRRARRTPPPRTPRRRRRSAAVSG